LTISGKPLFHCRNIYGEAVVICRILGERSTFNIEINEAKSQPNGWVRLHATSSPEQPQSFKDETF
jgi:hypothetical protein